MDAVLVVVRSLDEEDEEEREEILHSLAALIEFNLARVEVVRDPNPEVVTIEVVAELVTALKPPRGELLRHGLPCRGGPDRTLVHSAARLLLVPDLPGVEL